MFTLFDKTISVYKSVYDNKGTSMKMIDFLQGDYKYLVEGLRSCEDDGERKRLKNLLPCATISGWFSPTRAAANMVEHSGAICIDIDKQDNPKVDFVWLKKELSEIGQVAYVSYSASGNGLFVIIPIAFPNLHKEQFRAIEKDFNAWGIVVDSNCTDVSRLRFASYDDEPYINPIAEKYGWVCREHENLRQQRRAIYTGNDDTLLKVERTVTECERLGINLTENYDDWRDIGFALASLGESGRCFYHRLSRMSSKYAPIDCDRKFENLLHNRQRISIGTFFYHAKMWGVNVSKKEFSR